MGVYIPVLAQEVRYQARMTVKNFQTVLPRGSLMPSWSWEMAPGWVKGYSLEIPKLGIQEPVVENVNTQDKTGYMEALTKGVAHALGTGSPGKPGVQYYFAHSSGLPFWGGRAVTFATLNKLDLGDEITIYKEDGKYNYTVVDKQIVTPDDVRMLTEVSGDERVVLQTCWPLGTNWKRLLVIATRK
jgi:sortase A